MARAGGGYVFGLIGTILALSSRLTPAETLLLVPFISASLAYLSSYFMESRRERFERQERIERLLEKDKPDNERDK